MMNNIIENHKDVTYEQMSDWLHLHISDPENHLIVKALLSEIGYDINDDVLLDDNDTKKNDLYKNYG